MTPERPSDDGPSHAEVQQRISSLYDQAENATGKFNATRAMSKNARARRGSGAWRGSGGTDPALDRVARKWFDVGRAQLGPTVPAVLPPDRRPDPGNSPAVAPRRRPAEVREALGPEGSGPTRPELSGGPAGPVPELPAAARDTTRPPELTAATVAEPTARPMEPPAPGTTAPAPTSTTEALTNGTTQPPTGTTGAFLTGTTQPPAGPVEAFSAGIMEGAATGAVGMLAGIGPSTAAPPAGPVAGFTGVAGARREAAGGAGAPVPPHGDAAVRRPAKERTRGKLTRAGDMLARHAARDSTPPPAAVGTRPAEEPRPAAPSPRPEAAQWQQHATGLFDTTPPLDGNALFDASQAGHHAGVGASPASAYERKAAKALAFARAQIGKPCVWGATGPGSYDCSGLIQAAWRVAGVALPRTAHEQAGSGTAIQLDDLEPGDLVFFHGEVGHVGLYAGDGTMVHAPSPGASIREESVLFAGPRALHSAIRPA
ncbi:NlpC/P60 family protein [Streptomyces cyslabdanicus]|uniref:NlpC/P60 family protein n=1 Tax=Streptomyces cyslabdanicus TaxID=1470456 RepID=UPI004044329E